MSITKLSSFLGFVLLLVVPNVSSADLHKIQLNRDNEEHRRQKEMIADIPEQEIDQNETTYEHDADEGKSYEHDVTKRHSIFSPVRTQFMKGRRKRAANDIPTKWNHDIPVVFDPNYLEFGERIVDHVKRAMKRISDNVCVTYHDVTDLWDPNNPTWFTENGFKSNAYLLVKGDGGCAASNGQGDGTGPREVRLCQGFAINLHELYHTLGGAHDQQGLIRDNFITINHDNIKPELQGTYDIVNLNEDRMFLNDFFDPQSNLMYGDKTWSSNGLETYTPIRDDIFDVDQPTSSDDIIFYELSQIYRCNELFCGDKDTDCGLGYHTLVEGKCRCVCPAELDPENNCQTLVNGASRLSWPDTPMTVLAGGSDHTCPTGFNREVGWFSFTGIWRPKQLEVPVLLPSSEKNIYFPVCTRRAPADGAIDWSSWPPGGAYCIIKPDDTSCGGAFGEFTLEFQSLAPVRFNGSLGDITVKEENVTMKLCCRYSEPYGLPLELPNQDPFRLLAKGGCPRVLGMREYKGLVDLFTATKTVYGDVPPQYYIFKNELQIFQCYYLPPIYGCNQNIKLTATDPSATITTPGFGKARESNRRCFYAFEVPSNTRIRITFNTYDVHEDDKVLVKRYHKWQQQHRIPNARWPYQIVSDKEYFSMEYWSSWLETTAQGLSFTADLLLPEDSCYDVKSRGEDYVGDTSISETYEECLTWAEAAECADFPVDGLNSVRLLTSGNKCRNPKGQLDQPWCYTYKNGTNCHKRFCDVCNEKSPVDILRTCDILIKEDPSFCESGIQRFGCFNSCGFSQQSTDRATCGPPTLPEDGELVGTAKRQYLEGERVVVNCSKDATSPQSDMLCTKRGWTTLAYACEGTTCKDLLGQGICERAMSGYPNFCQNDRLKSIAEQSCRRSCGHCDVAAQCQEPVSRIYTRTSSSSSINPGEVMTFACNRGYYYVSGDFARACSSSGDLIGQPLQCQAEPVATDLNFNLVRKRSESLPRNLAVLLDHDNYRIPFKSLISKWYFYCNNAGSVYFLVYRHVNGIYTYVGSNSVTCVPRWPWSLNVPETEQILAYKDDVIGVFSPDDDTLAASNCIKASTQLLPNPFVYAKDLDVLKTKQFSGKYCLVPSVGVHLVPAA